MSHASFIVKICGITNEEDARIAIQAGANAVGFNFYPRSPRYIAPERARQIAAATPGDYLKVGVFVKPSVKRLLQVASQVPLDVVQLHGDSVALPSSRTLRVWRALPATAAPPPAYSGIEAYLLDSPTPHHGGSGETFDWSLAARFPHRAIIAGGLDASNVAEAIRITSPWGVDSCSRLESAPGKKDAQRVRDFICAAFAAARQEVTL
ncbi:MAG TPA: phosphoribosylanthranilate isomerase [Bryobacteraceae bacterium]|jgi:phosphoribosylanthranilate isomerase|nr:phosphoribosylanthranilate isomerase [Bryobacteraceae bacterium]